MRITSPQTRVAFLGSAIVGSLIGSVIYWHGRERSNEREQIVGQIISSACGVAGVTGLINFRYGFSLNFDAPLSP